MLKSINIIKIKIHILIHADVNGSLNMVRKQTKVKGRLTLQDRNNPVSTLMFNDPPLIYQAVRSMIVVEEREDKP
jgi:hypothetical protein